MSTASQKYVIMRVDGGDVIGYGHIMRSTGLAQALKDAGLEPVFYTRYVDGSGISTLKKNGINPVTIPDEVAETNDEPGWILSHMNRTMGAPGLTVIDGYHIPDAHRKLYARSTAVMVSDVFGGRDYRDCDLVFNAYADAADLDYSRLSSKTELLLGPEYAILREQVVKRLVGKVYDQPDRIRKVLINGGGVDEHDVTGRVASALAALPEKQFPEEALFVTGTMYPFEERLDQRIKRLPFARRLVQPENWLDLLKDSDLILMAGGSTQYEAAALGTPYICLPVEENQLGFARSMERLGCTEVIGWLNDLTDDQILQAYLRFASDSQLRSSLAQKARSLVDGQGATRVAQACMEHFAVK